MEEKKTITELIEQFGNKTVLNELLQWLPNEAINEFVEDFINLYDVNCYDTMEH